MIVRKRCSISFLIVCTIIALLVVNLLVYFIVDMGLIFTISPTNQNVKFHVTPTSPPDIRSKKKSNLSDQPGAVKQRRIFPVNGSRQQVASINASRKIRVTLSNVAKKYDNKSSSVEDIVAKVLRELRVIEASSLAIWSNVDQWATGTETVPTTTTLLGSALNSLCSSKIMKADNSKKGTQLKIAVTLEGGQHALFKPQWYKREETIPGPVYAGKDRHNAEVAAFHLSLLLGLRRVPLTVGRRIDLRREVLPVATQELRETFFQEGNNTCFYGVCLYCKPTDPVCAKRDVMEGALILWLPSRLHFSRYAHPWQRSYRQNLLARWEVEARYCDKVKKLKQYSGTKSTRLLDLIDAAIFDFLISNGDRHHYEMPDNIEPASVFLFDNGKSFGNSEIDHIDILAPLYQCCMLRLKTWKTLQLFRAGALSISLERLLQSSHIAPVLTTAHFKSLDRRLLLIFSAVEICINENGSEAVLQ